MEVGTVVITVREYDELRQFKSNVESGKVVKMVDSNMYFGNRTTSYLNLDDVMDEASRINTNLLYEIGRYKSQVQEGYSKQNIKSMSIIEFLKLKWSK